eukprot:scaffold6695_cov136-Isochrysis_galbana.AAC.3
MAGVHLDVLVRHAHLRQLLYLWVPPATGRLLCSFRDSGQHLTGGRRPAARLVPASRRVVGSDNMLDGVVCRIYHSAPAGE